MGRKTSKAEAIGIAVVALMAAPIVAVSWLYSVIGWQGVAGLVLAIGGAVLWFRKSREEIDVADPLPSAQPVLPTPPSPPANASPASSAGWTPPVPSYSPTAPQKTTTLFDGFGSAPAHKTTTLFDGFTSAVQDVEPLDEVSWDDGLDYGPANPKPVSGRLEILYRDAQGERSRREVAVRECDIESASSYLMGICQLRGAYRTFRIDRVVRATDLETGEVVADLPGWAYRKYQDSPAFVIEKLLDESSDVLRALFYIGKADGRFTKKEKQVFLAYCTANLVDRALGIEDVDRICRQLDVPSKQAFKLICGRLGALGWSQRLAIITAADEMVATEKTIGAEEAEALAYLKKRLAVDA